MKKLLLIVMCSLLILFCVSACALDSESIVPLIIAVVSVIGMLICNVLYRKEYRNDLRGFKKSK